jgi:hypothetical protein
MMCARVRACTRMSDACWISRMTEVDGAHRCSVRGCPHMLHSQHHRVFKRICVYGRSCVGVWQRFCIGSSRRIHPPFSICTRHHISSWGTSLLRQYMDEEGLPDLRQQFSTWAHRPVVCDDAQGPLRVHIGGRTYHLLASSPARARSSDVGLQAVVWRLVTLTAVDALDSTAQAQPLSDLLHGLAATNQLGTVAFDFGAASTGPAAQNSAPALYLGPLQPSAHHLTLSSRPRMVSESSDPFAVGGNATLPHKAPPSSAAASVYHSFSSSSSSSASWVAALGAAPAGPRASVSDSDAAAMETDVATTTPVVHPASQESTSPVHTGGRDVAAAAPPLSPEFPSRRRPANAAATSASSASSPNA